MRKYTIVLVDDEQNVLDSMKRVLRNDAYEIKTFENAQDSWKYIDRQRGNVDIVISDNKMPHTDGTTLLVAICKGYPDIIRIMLTGQSSLDDAKLAINEGEVYKFLTKPCDPDELRLTVCHALAQKDLWERNKRLIDKVKEQADTIEELEKKHPGIAHVKKDSDGSIIIDEGESESLDEFMKKYFS